MALYQYLASPQNISAEAGYSCAKATIYAPFRIRLSALALSENGDAKYWYRASK